jgi:hypothetical protein
MEVARMRRAALAAALALAVASPARAADPAAEAAKSYTLEAYATPRTVKPGGSGTLSIVVTPSRETHVHPQAPLKVTLRTTEGLKLDKTTLGRADLADPKGGAPRFVLTFAATGTGAQSATATVDFFICSDQWCVKQVREVSIPVDVK